MNENVGRDKTFLILFSFVIIIYQFANEMTIARINILGNEVTVDENLVIWSVILCWVYFLWGFLIKHGIDFKPNNSTNIYKHFLKLFANKVIKNDKEIKAVVNKYYREGGVRTLLRIDDYSDLNLILDSYTVRIREAYHTKNFPLIDEVRIHKKKFYPCKIKAYLLFLILDEKSREIIFPVIISLIALIFLLINSVEVLIIFVNKNFG